MLLINRDLLSKRPRALTSRYVDVRRSDTIHELLSFLIRLVLAAEGATEQPASRRGRLDSPAIVLYAEFLVE